MLATTRRQFLRSAGGITFLALAPVGRGLFAALTSRELSATPVPLFTALPYIQPGPEGRLIAGQETVRIAWQTETKPAEFRLRFGADKSYGRTGSISKVDRAPREERVSDGRFNYVASLDHLELGQRYFYEVKCGEQLIVEGYFTTRQPRGQRIRFATFGDNSYGDISDRAIAFQTYEAHPDFVMNTGDNVYESGLDDEYSRFFFPVYNADVAGPRLGAPLLRSIPFYTVLANHDVAGKSSDGVPVANFDHDPDSLAYYTNFHLPLNGLAPAQPTPVIGALKGLNAFRACAGLRYPTMANYSYDYGDAHFLCLDANIYVDPTVPELQAWIEHDLRGTDATWKFVTYHHPAFNVGTEHYHEQHMRVLTPLFEQCGVDFVLNGHEHNYQRTRPLRFKPHGMGKAAKINSKDRLVPGTFTVDQTFDGEKQTRPNGIIYLTTGAGGKTLYGANLTGNPHLWRHPEDNNVDYVDRLVADRHSLSIIDLDGPTLLLRQIDEYGQEIDRIRVSKG